MPMRTVEAVDQVQQALVKGVEAHNGLLWICLIDRINPLSRENVKEMMSHYDPKSPVTLYDLAEIAGLETRPLAKDWILRDFYPDYRESEDPTSQAINDIYDNCRLFLSRKLETAHQDDEPFGFKVSEGFYTRVSTRALQIAEIARKLHEEVVHPIIARMHTNGIQVRLFAATSPGLQPSVLLSAS